MSVKLVLPASSDYVRVARLVSSGVGERLGFDFETVDELRIAVDELCHAAIDSGAEGSMRLSFDLTANGLEVEVRVDSLAHHDGERSAFGLTPLSRQILAAIVDSTDTGRSDGEEWFRFRKAFAH